MTRSNQVSAKKAFNKVHRTEARSLGCNHKFWDLVTSANEAAKEKKTNAPTPVTRRNPGRMDGTRWNGGHFICGRQIDDDLVDHADADALELHQESHQEIAEDKQRTIEVEVAIMDIAKLAKVKGVAKEYEVIETVRKVIALEENEREDDLWDNESDLWDDESDDWEELYHEEIKQRRSYSGVLRGYDT